jgi:DnaJ family protein C protein 28
MKNDKRSPEPMQDIAARAIEEAMERGDFDNLPGKGKPLRLDPGEMADPVGFANKVRKNAGFIAPWSLLEEEIAGDLRRAEAEILLAHRHRRAALRNPQADPGAIEHTWSQALEIFRSHLDKVNSKILKFNLLIPSQLPHLHKPRLRVDDVLRKLQING